jgi:hypothetical protein
MLQHRQALALDLEQGQVVLLVHAQHLGSDDLLSLQRRVEHQPHGRAAGDDVLVGDEQARGVDAEGASVRLALLQVALDQGGGRLAQPADLHEGEFLVVVRGSGDPDDQREQGQGRDGGDQAHGRIPAEDGSVCYVYITLRDSSRDI